MSRSDRKSLLLRLAAARGVPSAVAFLSGQPVAAMSSAESLAPVPSAPSPILTKAERAQVARDVLAAKIARDLSAYDSPKASGWLVVAEITVTVSVEVSPVEIAA